MNYLTDDLKLEYDSHLKKNTSDLKLEPERSKSLRRYLVPLLICLGTLNTFILRNNLTIAMVEMRSNKTLVIGNQTIIQKPEFNWDSKTRGFLLSLFYYGLLASPMGGYLASKYGGVRIYGCGILTSALLTLLTPTNLRLNFTWFAFCRVLEGIADAMTLPSIQAIAADWSKPEERSKFLAFGYTGIYIGTTISLPMSGYLAYRFDWTAIFYGTGSIALLWALIWFLVVPTDHSLDGSIPNSRQLIKSTPESPHKKKLTYPWKRILTTRTLWILIIARISFTLGWNIVSLYLPLYLRDVTSYTTSKIGLVSAIPNATSIFAMPLFGLLADYLIGEKILSITQVHKLYLGGSLFTAGAILICIGFVSEYVFILCSVFFNILLSFSVIVIQVMPVCIAPIYSSLISGISLLWQTVITIISPVCFGFIVTNHSVEEWRTYFISTAALMIVGSVTFFIYSSSEVQPWAIVRQDEDDIENEMKNLKENCVR